MVFLPEGYDVNWIVVIMLPIMGALLIGALFCVSKFIAPKRFSKVKDEPYECGIPPEPFRWSQIRIRYYIFAILFIIFDIEAVFLFPWAIIYLKSGSMIFYEMLIFLGILFFGIIYSWRKGVLQWR